MSNDHAQDFPTADWRRRAAIYQIYPKSYRDADGDGVGDIKGVIEKLDYIADLGVDVVWLSPIFASPMVDNGYDVSDYRAVHPPFGTLRDVDDLIEEAAKRRLRIVLDIALNHSSTEHRWFQAALADPTGPFADYYIWRPTRNGAPPNNWRSVFGGPAWTAPDGGERAYLHLFDRTQADLNWDNPAVREEIYAALRFWLDRGIGGFRLDVVTLISKDPALPDMPDLPLLERYKILASGPRLHEYLREMRREVFSRYDCIAIGEGPGLTPKTAAQVVDPDDPMLDIVYHFDLVEPPLDVDGRWDKRAFKQVFQDWETGIGARGWNTVVLSNHDLGRIVSRFGDDAEHGSEQWRASATMLQTLVILMRGTPFLYQGDELGLVNAAFEDIDQLDDVWAKNLYDLRKARGASEAEAFAAALAVTRDHARTPFPWRADDTLGFSHEGVKPWLAPNPRHAALCAATQAGEPESPLLFAKALLRLRRSDAIWTDGALRIRPEPAAAAFVFERSLAGRTGIVALNLSGAPLDLAEPLAEEAPALANRFGPFDPRTLAPYEARVYAPETV